ncbi:MAG: hypothetical protein ACP5RE_04020 [Candidatus Acidifodinimicrobium sp.]
MANMLLLITSEEDKKIRILPGSGHNMNAQDAVSSVDKYKETQPCSMMEEA